MKVEQIGENHIDIHHTASYELIDRYVTYAHAYVSSIAQGFNVLFLERKLNSQTTHDVVANVLHLKVTKVYFRIPSYRRFAVFYALKQKKKEEKQLAQAISLLAVVIPFPQSVLK